MAKTFKSISFESEDHEAITQDAAKYSEQVGVKVSPAQFLNMLRKEWEKKQEDDA